MHYTIQSPEYVDWSAPVNWNDPLNRGLVARWMAVPGAMGYGSKSWRDIVKNQVGTLTGMTPSDAWKGPGVAPGAWGGLNFRGTATNSDYVDTTFDTALDDFTAIITFLARNANMGGSGRLFAKNEGTGFAIQRNAANSWYGLCKFSGGGDLASITNVPDDQRNQIAMVRSGAGFDCYANGVFRSSGICANSGPISSDALQFGKEFFESRAYLDGIIYDAAIWDRTLSAEEVREWNDDSLAYSPRTLRRWKRKSYFVPAAAGSSVAKLAMHYRRMMTVGS